MYQDRNNSKKLIKPFVALANTPLKDLKWVGLSEEDKIRLRKLYPKPWMDQEFRWSCPLTTIPDVPIGKLNGAVIPEECEVDFYTELYGDEARCYFDVLSKAEKSEKIFADASEQANAMIPVQNQMQGPAPISAWESGMVSGGRQNAFAANQFQAPVPVFTPMEGRVFSEKDCNDADTADNICRILDGSYIYVAEQKCYYQWNQRIWEKMPVLEFKKRIVAILQKRFVYVRTKETDVDMDYARKLCDNKKIDDIIQIINAKIYVNEEKLNQDSGLLCAKNGIYNFLSRTVMPHGNYKNLYITRMVDAEYIDAMNQPRIFRDFIDDVMSHDRDMIDFIQRAFGYAVIGHPKEQKCFVLIGNGANGKTTLIDAISNVLGAEYCTTMSKKMITAEDRGGANEASPAIVQLKGKRMAFASELKRNDKIVEAQFKKMIGGGKLSGRKLYHNTVEFKNESVIFIDTNHLPEIETGGLESAHAIFRRMEIIPFKQRYTEENKNVNLPDLLQSECAKNEILAWLIEGANQYLKYGLVSPFESEEIKNTYMQRENSLANFFETLVIRTDQAEDRVPSAELYGAYLDFCQRCHYTAVHKNRFFKSQNVAGLKPYRTANERGYEGIQLKLG